MKTILALILLISTNAFGDEWTRGDTYREAAFQTLNVIDWGQTRYIAQNPDRFIESTGGVGYGGSARYIGEHPTVNGVNTYMAESAVIHYAISKALVHYGYHTAAEIFQYVTIGQKLDATLGNVAVGVKVAF